MHRIRISSTSLDCHTSHPSLCCGPAQVSSRATTQRKRQYNFQVWMECCPFRGVFFFHPRNDNTSIPATAPKIILPFCDVGLAELHLCDTLFMLNLILLIPWVECLAYCSTLCCGFSKVRFVKCESSSTRWFDVRINGVPPSIVVLGAFRSLHFTKSYRTINCLSIQSRTTATVSKATLCFSSSDWPRGVLSCRTRHVVAHQCRR